MSGILVINAGSSSIKFALFDAELETQVTGQVAEIGGDTLMTLGDETRGVEAADHEAALALCLEGLEARGFRPSDLRAAAHRVVHGGRGLQAACRVTPDVEAEIAACIPLAPLHNPHNLGAIRALGRIAPDLPQYASFDTAFHATAPEVAQRYAIPEAEDAKGIRRYGFHGISYAGLVRQLPDITGAPLPGRLLALHLGNGASLCAIHEGRSVATTMGYSPLDGLTMGTRCGAIDGNAVLRLAEEHGVKGAADLLNRQSGLIGLAGESDMRRLHALAEGGDEAARFAIAHVCYWILRHAGSMIAAMGGLDGIAFTGGIGENDAQVRAEVMAGLAWLGLEADAGANAARGPALHRAGSRVGAWIVPAKEEQTIARDALGAGA